MWGEEESVFLFYSAIESYQLDCFFRSLFVTFWQPYRAHEGLEGKTPAEACGIKVEGKNKWLTLIQNACNTEDKGTD